MNYKPIIIVAGEPNSIFFEIFIKTINKKKFKSPIILIGSKKLLKKQIRYFKSKIKFHELNYSKKKLRIDKLNMFNLIDIEYDQEILFDKISNKSNKYLTNCFKTALEILKKKSATSLLMDLYQKNIF